MKCDNTTQILSARMSAFLVYKPINRAKKYLPSRSRQCIEQQLDDNSRDMKSLL